MANWMKNLFSKKQDEPLEDFILYDSNEKATNEPAESFSDTARLDISSELSKEKGKIFSPFFSQHKKRILSIGIPVVALILIATLLLTIPPLVNPLRGYAQGTVTRGNVISTMNTSGTLSANAHYSITSLVSGTVLECPVEVGDRVEAGTVLYQLDDTDAQIALKRAENQLERSKAVGSYAGTPLRIYASEAGVIQSITIRSGNSVSAGQIIGTIKRADDTVVSITASVSGTVSTVNVGHGSSVSAGSLIATIQDSQAEISRRTSQYDQKSNEYDIEAARNQINNYTIVAPVGGVVTEKNAKVGDNVAMSDTKNPMLVITDTSFMRFTFQIDESKVSEVKAGLRVSVTTDSVPNKTFNGKIQSVSSEGVRSKSGKLLFDVEVLVENPGSLKTGMNVSAKIILATANNTLHVPVKALRNPDGKSAVVLVKTNGSGDMLTSSTALKKAKAAKIEIPKGCRLATVQYGINDGTNVQIISGLKLDEVVVYSPDWEIANLKLAAPVTNQPSGGLVGLPTNSDTTVISPGNSVNEPSTEDDEALRQEIMNKIRESQAASSSEN